MARGERGSVLPAVLGLLVVLSLAATALLANAMQSRDAAGEDRRVKQARAVAEAGLQVALQRLNEATSLGPAACLVGPASGAECPQAGTGVTSGGSFEYRVSQQLNGTTITCGKLPGHTVTGPERCITARGTVNGVRRRLQMLVSQRLGGPLFGSAGVVGEEGMQIGTSAGSSNRFYDGMPIGSNGTIAFQNTGHEVTGTAILGPAGGGLPAGSVSGNSGYLQGSPAQALGSTRWQLQPLPIEDPVPPTVGNTYANHLLSTSWYRAADAGQPRRRFHMSSGTYTLPAGSYNFCQLSLHDSVTLNVMGPVKVYIDHPRRPGSDCGSGASNYGRVLMGNTIEVNYGGNAANFQLYLYGSNAEDTNPLYTCPTGRQYRADVVLCNSVLFDGTIYAPNSQVVLDNSVRLRGAIAAKRVLAVNSTEMWWPNSVRSISGLSRGSARTAWIECQPVAPVASDPESGC
jgi:Tfp pilus assembly protein PilX